MSTLDKLKSRLGLGQSWDAEYLDEGDQEPELQRNDYAGEQAARDALMGVGFGASSNSGSSATGDDDAGERRYARNSPFASGAAPSAVTKHARKPDLKRASEISGRELREVEANRRYSHQPKISPDGSTITPKDYSEALLVANHLKEGKAVTVDLSLVESSQRQRFIDFMAGLVYALDGHLARASSNVYVLTPR